MNAIPKGGSFEGTAFIGEGVPRVDGRAKVTGAAPYAADFEAGPDTLHAVTVDATIARGRVLRLDLVAASRAPGVVQILTPPIGGMRGATAGLPWGDTAGGSKSEMAPQGKPFMPLKDDRVAFQGQPLAVVIADTLEHAQFAASLVGVAYAPEPSVVAVEEAARLAEPPPAKVQQEHPAETSRGDFAKAFAEAPVKVEGSYLVPRETHNPIETHATVARWEGDAVHIHDKTQWVGNVAREIASAFGVDKAKVRVVSPFVGGAFGGAGRVWPHTYLAVLAAKATGRTVKLQLTRRQMHHWVGFRPWTRMTVALAAARDGRLEAIRHEAVAETSRFEAYGEATLKASRFLYGCENVATRYDLFRRDTSSPTFMRAPGEATGLFALEVAMDELAVALGMDPVALRLANIPARDLHDDLPFSSNALAACLRAGAERFGWAGRNPAPGATRDGRLLVGLGMAGGTYPTNLMGAKARARLRPDGIAEVEVASSDMGPGTWTSMTQVAADVLGLPMARVRLAIGDSALPQAPPHGGSMTMASVGSAVHAACTKLRGEVYRAAGVNGGDLGELARGLSKPVEVEAAFSPGDVDERFSMHAFGAVFAEVTVDPDTMETRVRRLTGAYGNGRIVNPRLARSQVIGGLIGGLGMALMEETEVDGSSGRVANASLADYLVPVLADTPAIDLVFVPEEDPNLGPLGAKGVGELSYVGVAPAIANAVFHATGTRVRELPLTPDKLVAATRGA